MIELTLNLIWAAVAIAAFAFVLPRTRQRWAASIALSCILVLLFPIISVSDDLSAQWEAIDEATAVRRVHHVLHVSPFPAVLAAAAIFVVNLALIGAIECRVVPTPSVLLSVRNSPRSPPRCQ
jgi:hypothetical protein